MSKEVKEQEVETKDLKETKKTKKSKKNPMTELDDLLGISEDTEKLDLGEAPEFMSLKETKKETNSIPDYLKY
jgi:hypothetical protein